MLVLVPASSFDLVQGLAVLPTPLDPPVSIPPSYNDGRSARCLEPTIFREPENCPVRDQHAAVKETLPFVGGKMLDGRCGRTTSRRSFVHHEATLNPPATSFPIASLAEVNVVVS